MTEKRQPTQKTQPKGKDETGRPHKPVDIPVPKSGEIDHLLKKAAKPPRSGQKPTT